MKNIVYLMTLFMLIVLTGCGGFKTRMYMVDRPRVDQEASGNAGYLVGKSNTDEKTQEQAEPVKETRKVFVLEFTDKRRLYEQKVVSEEKMEVKTTSAPAKQNFTASRAAKRDKQHAHSHEMQEPDPTKEMMDFTLPTFPEDDFYLEEVTKPKEAKPVTAAEYVVKKDDTLQKISKKFYDSYSKWPKIYDANREVIKDPNFLKPGITIKIPHQE